MKELTTLIPALGGLFSSDAWLGVCNWTFWFLLFVIAAGGLICALLGKGSLINRSICGTVNMAVIYLAVIGLYYLIPGWRATPTEFPFMAITQDSLTLVNPFTLGFKAAVPVVTRFMILIFLLHCTAVLCQSSTSLLIWCFWQFVSAGISWGFYTVLCMGLKALSPSLLNKWSIIPLALFWGLFVLYWIAKVVVLVLMPGNRYFTAVHTFLTTNPVGAIFTKTALTTFTSTAFVWVLCRLEYNRIVFAEFDFFSFMLISLMFVITLYIFSMIFSDRKKG